MTIKKTGNKGRKVSDKLPARQSNVTSFNEAKDKVTGGKRCYHDHPPLPLKDGLVVYGGSCITPAVTDANIYVGFDAGMNVDMAKPWNGQMAVRFKITDMSVPSDVGEVCKLVAWLQVQLCKGRKVHLGCIGGHGRTGTIMAVLVKEMLGEADAIRYVRKHYCKKVVESDKQIDWLNRHFGITKAEPTKMALPSYGAGGYDFGDDLFSPSWAPPKGHTPHRKSGWDDPPAKPGQTEPDQPAKVKSMSDMPHVWGASLVLKVQAFDK